MASRFKLIGIVLIALATSGMAATAAQAEGLFVAEEYPADLVGEQTETFEFEVEGLGTVKCAVADFSGEITGSSSSVTLAPDFEACTVSGSEAIFVNGGCQIVAYGGEEISEEEFKSPMDIACEEAAALEFHLPATGCVLSVDGQAGLGDLFIKFQFGFPPDLVIGAKIGEITGEIKNTVGKKCVLPVGMVKLNVNGGLTLGASVLGAFIGLELK